MKLTDHEKRIMGLIAEPITPTELSRFLGNTRRAAWASLKKLCWKGRLKPVGAGRYWFARPEIDGVEI